MSETIMTRRIGWTGLALLLLASLATPQAMAQLTGNTNIANQATVNYQSADGTAMDAVTSTVNILVTPVYAFEYANFSANRVINSGGTVPTSNPVTFDFVNTGNVSDTLINVATTQFAGDGNLALNGFQIQFCEGDGTFDDSSPDGQDLTCGAVPATVDIWASGVHSVTLNDNTTTPTIAIYSNITGTADPATNNDVNFSIGDLVQLNDGANCEITNINLDQTIGALTLDELVLGCDATVDSGTVAIDLVGERKQFQITATATDLPSDGSDTHENVFYQASVESTGNTNEYCTGADGQSPCTTDFSDTDDFDLSTNMTVAVVGPALSVVKYQSDGGAGSGNSNCEVTGHSYNSILDFVGDTAGDDCQILDVPSGTTMTYLIRVTNADTKTDASTGAPAACFDAGTTTNNQTDNDCAGNADEVIVADAVSEFLILDTTSVVLDLDCNGDGVGTGDASSSVETLAQNDGKLWDNSGVLTVYADGPGNDVGDDSSATPVGGTISPNTQTCVAFQADVI